MLRHPEPGREGFGFGSPPVSGRQTEVDARSGGDVLVPDAQLLFQGDYSRVGFDLVIENDGNRLVVHDFFRPGNRPNLVSQEGASLSGEVVEALALSSHGPRSAQAGAAPVPQTIGRVETVSGTASVLRNGSAMTLNVGDPVYRGDVVQTGGGSSLGITFIDGTAFSLLSGARMVLNDMVYTPGGAGNSALLSLVQGSISFVAGQVAKTGDMRVDTPVATMGIRGTAVNVEISADNGTTRFSVMREPDGTVGSYVLYSKTDPNVVIATVSQVDTAVTVESNGTIVNIVKTPADLASEQAIVQRVFQLFSAAQANPIPVTPGPPPSTSPGGPQGGGAGGSSTPQGAPGGDGSLGPALTQPPAVTAPEPDQTPSGAGPTGNGPPPASTPPADGGATDPQRDSAAPASGGTVVAAAGAPVPETPAQNTPVGETPAAAASQGRASPGQGASGPPVGDTAPTPTRDGQTGSTDTAETPTPDTPTPETPTPESPTGSAEAVAPFTPRLVAVAANEVVLVSGRSDGLLAREGVSDASLAAELVVSARGSGSGTVQVGSAMGIVVGSYGTLAIAADGSYSYVALRATELALGQTADDVFTFTVAEADGTRTTSSLTFRVEGQNDAPVAIPDAVALDLAAGSTIPAGANVLANDVDPDRGETAALRVSAARASDASGVAVGPATPATVAGRYGDLTIAADGTYSYAATRAAALGAGVADDDAFGYTITDPHGATSSAGLTFRVTGVNDAPVAAARSGVVEAGRVASATSRATGLLADARDPDAGETALLVVSSAGAGDNAAASVGEGQPASIAGAYGTLTLAADGTYRYAADRAASVPPGETVRDVFTYVIVDPHGATSSNSLTFEVTGTNSPPSAAADDASVAQGSRVAAASRTSGLLANDTDPDPGQTGGLTLVGVAHGSGSVPVGEGTVVSGAYGTLTISSDGRYDYVADRAAGIGEGAGAVDLFRYVVADAYGATATAEFRVTVTGVNDAPTARPDGASLLQGGRLDAGNRGSGLLGNDTDPDAGEAARLVVTSIKAGAGAAADLTPLARSYLAAGQNLIGGLGGTAGFGENVLSSNDDDSTGAIDVTAVFGAGGLNFFGRYFQTVYINNNGNITFTGPSGDFTPDPIAGTADNPIIAPFWYDVDTRSGAGAPTPGGNSTGSNLVHYDLDPANHVLTVTWDDVGYFPDGTDRPNAYQLQLIGRGAGDFDIVFRYEATQYGGSGGARAGYSAGDASHSYELPQSGDAGAMTSLDRVVGNTGRVGVDLFEVRDGVARNPVEVSGATVVAGTYGTLTVSPDGTYGYAADRAAALGQGVHGIESFLYAITDPFGAVSEAALTFDVTGVNDAPTAVALSNRSVAENAAGAVIGVLTATDPDSGDTFGYAVFDSRFEVAAGTLKLVDGIALDHEGEPSLDLRVRVTDAAGASHDETFTITVDDVNEAPIARDVQVTLAEDNAASVPLAASDVDGDALSYVIVTAPGHGTVSLQSGTYVYAPDQDYSGPDSFTYRASDGSLESNVATVTLTVTPVNDAPTVTGASTGTVREDAVTTSDGQLAATDPDSGGSPRWTVAGGTAAHPADYLVRVDSLTITRSATGAADAPVLYRDTFDTAPPTSDPTFGTGLTYSNTLPRSEGRLILRDEDGTTAIGTGTTDPYTRTTTTLQSSTNNTSTFGLKKGADFTVRAVFDLVTPDDLREFYGLQLHDNAGDDTAEVIVRLGSDGVQRVQLRAVDSVANTVTNVSSALLQPFAGDDQIALRFMHEAGSGTVTAAFDYLSGGAVTHTGALAVPANLFGSDTPSTADDENFVRARLVAFAPATADSHLAGTYGTLAVNQTGQWIYTLNNAGAAVQALGTGDSVTDAFAILAADSQSAQSAPYGVTITVQGADEPAPTAVGETLVFPSYESGTLTIPDAALLYNDGLANPNVMLAVSGTSDNASHTVSPTYRFAVGATQDDFTYTIRNANTGAVSGPATVTLAGTGDGSSLTGGPGSDVLLGRGDAVQTMTGGAGRDVFVLSGTQANAHTVTDYAFADDAFDISKLVETGRYFDGGNVNLDLVAEPFGIELRIFDSAGSAEVLAHLTNADVSQDADATVIWYGHRQVVHYDAVVPTP